MHRTNGAFMPKSNTCFPNGPPAPYLLPFEQAGYIQKTSPTKRKLENKTTMDHYLRALSPTQYLVLLRNGATSIVCAALHSRTAPMDKNKKPRKCHQRPAIGQGTTKMPSNRHQNTGRGKKRSPSNRRQSPAAGLQTPVV